MAVEARVTSRAQRGQRPTDDSRSRAYNPKQSVNKGRRPRTRVQGKWDTRTLAGSPG